MRIRKILPLTLALLVVATLAACGSTEEPETSVASLSDESGEGGEATETTVDPDEAFLAFAECMREEGIPIEDPNNGEFKVTAEARAPAGEGENEEGNSTEGDIGSADKVTVNGVEVDPEDFQAAQEACEHLMDEVVASRELDPEEQAEMQDSMLAFAECMRDQGYPWPDPVFEEDGGVMMDMKEPIDVESEEVQAAMDECGGNQWGPPLGPPSNSSGGSRNEE